MTKTSESLRADANRLDREAVESFERCDTDGFLSQWAKGITAEKKRMEADLLENDGLAEIACLVDDRGEILPAVYLPTRYGRCYALFVSFDAANANGGEIVEWLGNGKIRERGYRNAFALRKAKVKIVGSDAVNCRPVYVPADDLRVNPEAEVVTIFDD